MRDGTPSRTASWAAEMRAAHQIYDDPRIFVDPLALKIVGEEVERQIRGNPRQYRSLINRKVRTTFVARSRFCEDTMVAAVERGLRQLVILGAGLDTFAYRSPLVARARVFEVDHPATQAWKRQRLAAAGIVAPASLVFAPVDFEEVTLAEGLVRAGVDLSRPTFFSWLGVLFYLPPEVALSTLRFVGSALPPDSEIVFDYLMSSRMLSVAGQHAFAFLKQSAANLGEPWRTFFEPAGIAAELDRLGFDAVADVDAEAFALELGGPPYDFAPLGMTRLVRARVGPKDPPAHTGSS